MTAGKVAGVVTGVVVAIVTIIVVFLLVGNTSGDITTASNNISNSGLPLASLFASDLGHNVLIGV